VNALPTWTAVSPDVPTGCESLRLPSGADFGRGYALVVAVVPFADVLGDLDLSVAGQAGDILGPVSDPRQRLVQAEVEQFKSALGSLSRGDISTMPSARTFR
jgi:hypothetical protein